MFLPTRVPKVLFRNHGSRLLNRKFVEESEGDASAARTIRSRGVLGVNRQSPQPFSSTIDSGSFEGSIVAAALRRRPHSPRKPDRGLRIGALTPDTPDRPTHRPIGAMQSLSRFLLRPTVIDRLKNGLIARR